MTLIKTFFYLRIFSNMTQLVIMIKNVVADLRVFIFFFFMQIFMLSIILGVLAVGNYQDHENIKLSISDAHKGEDDENVSWDFS